MSDHELPILRRTLASHRAISAAMLAALKEAVECPRHSMENADWWGRVYAAIAQAEAAGITAED